jgi:hypothetical protein
MPANSAASIGAPPPASPAAPLIRARADHAGPENRLGRTRKPQTRPLHGHPGRTKPLLRHARLVRTPRPHRQTQNGRHRRRHAQKRRHRKRKSPNHRSPRNRVDDDRGSAEGSLFLGRDKGGSSSTAGEVHRPADPLCDEARQPGRDRLGNVNTRHAPGEAGKLHMDAIASIGTV